MSILHAFFVLMYCTGIIAAVYFIGEFLGLHVRHRRIARNRRWEREIGFKQCEPQEKP